MRNERGEREERREEGGERRERRRRRKRGGAKRERERPVHVQHCSTIPPAETRMTVYRRLSIQLALAIF